MASVRRAVGTVKEGAELAGALALSQPRITGTGSSQKFDNPWPEWQVGIRSAFVVCSAAIRALKRRWTAGERSH